MLRELYYLTRIRRNVWLSEKEIKKIQEKKMKKIIRFAYNNVKFYNDSFKIAGIKPGDIKTIKDLRKIPILNKNDLRDNTKDFVSKKVNLKKCKVKATSGSTGKPLKIIENRQSEAYGIAMRYRAYLENGFKFSHKIAEFTHPRHIVNKSLRLTNSLGILRKHRISIFKPVETHIKKINQIKPDIIEGYPSTLKLIALQDKGIYQPKKIFTTSESISDENRKIIKEKFKCDVIDFYGCTEIPRIAWECSEHEGYHIDADEVILELVNSPNNKNEGEILVTTLYNYCMPLIRYKVGDYGIRKNKPCSCGRGLPLIKRIEGRTDDFITLPDGKKVSPRCINLLDEIKGIKDYRTIQKEKNLFLVQIVKNKQFSKKTLLLAKKQIKKGCLGMDVKVKFQFLDEIPKDPSGKIRTVISEVKK